MWGGNKSKGGYNLGSLGGKVGKMRKMRKMRNAKWKNIK